MDPTKASAKGSMEEASTKETLPGINHRKPQREEMVSAFLNYHKKYGGRELFINFCRENIRFTGDWRDFIFRKDLVEEFFKHLGARWESVVCLGMHFGAAGVKTTRLGKDFGQEYGYSGVCFVDGRGRKYYPRKRPRKEPRMTGKWVTMSLGAARGIRPRNPRQRKRTVRKDARKSGGEGRRRKETKDERGKKEDIASESFSSSSSTSLSNTSSSSPSSYASSSSSSSFVTPRTSITILSTSPDSPPLEINIDLISPAPEPQPPTPSPSSLSNPFFGTPTPKGQPETQPYTPDSSLSSPIFTPKPDPHCTSPTLPSLFCSTSSPQPAQEPHPYTPNTLPSPLFFTPNPQPVSKPQFYTTLTLSSRQPAQELQPYNLPSLPNPIFLTPKPEPKPELESNTPSSLPNTFFVPQTPQPVLESKPLTPASLSTPFFSTSGPQWIPGYNTPGSAQPSPRLPCPNPSPVPVPLLPVHCVPLPPGLQIDLLGSLDIKEEL